MAVAVVASGIILAWPALSRLQTWLRLRLWYARARRRGVPPRAVDGSISPRELRQLGRIQASYDATDIPEPHYDQSGGGRA